MTNTLFTNEQLTELGNPKSLSDRGLRLLYRAAKAVPYAKRGNFLKQVISRLGYQASDASVEAVINTELDRIPQHIKNVHRDRWDQLFKGENK